MAKANQVALIIIACIALTGFLYFAGAVIAPVSFALFVIMLVWPVQRSLQSFLNRYIALLVTFIVVATVLVGFGWLIAWTFGQAGRRILADASRFQALYSELRIWLDAHGIAATTLWMENFNVSWTLGTIQSVGSRLNSIFSFWLVALIYVLLGLAEVDELSSRVKSLKNQDAAQLILRGSYESAAKIRAYMLLRAGMSVVTGLFVWLLTYWVGLPLASTWGFVAFILNFIPFLGPLVATVLITSFAATQFENWQFVLIVFICLNFIQGVVGSVIEPRVAGATLSLSPLAVLFSVFAWGALWGVFGAFIGVPITIAALTFCSLHPSTAWAAALFGFPPANADMGAGEVR